MNDSLTKIKSSLKQYKWLLLPIIPLLFFVTFLLFYDFSPESPSQISPSPLVQPTAFPTEVLPKSQDAMTAITETSNVFSQQHGIDLDEPLENRSDFQTKEDFQNGVTRFTFTSSLPDRQNILIIRGEETLFNREVVIPALETTIDDYIGVYGNPEEILIAPAYYGSDAVTYFNQNSGMAAVVNTKTNRVLERHSFPPVNSNKYQTLFKEYIQ